MCIVRKATKDENEGELDANAASCVGATYRTRGPDWKYANLSKTAKVTMECRHSDGRSSTHVLGPGEVLTDEDDNVALEIKKIERLTPNGR